MTDTIQTFDNTVDVMQVLLWQYNEAMRLQALLAEKQTWYDEHHTAFWDDWYRDVFNLRTANAFGLAVWSIILGQPIIFNNVGDPAQIPWGFEDETFHANFERGNFASTTGFTYVLSPAAARVALQCRYFQLISSGTVPETNRMLKFLFGDQGVAYLVDNGDMTQEYVFEFPVSSELLYLFNNYDVLPRPAGVSSTITVTT